MKKQCKFIETHNTTATGEPIRSIFVPRPTSWANGFARHQWLKKYFQQECAIASPDWWEFLIARHGKPKLLVEEDGQFRIEEIEE
tara:strand:- start:393 stop:647 length:255 start_codon:yes stop_codon:yes gene_type:complete